MKGAQEISLDGQPLSMVDEAILLLSVTETPPTETLSLLPRPTGGSLLLGRQRQSLTITATVEIRESDPLLRQDILNKICRWMQGRTLTLSSRPEQYLQVVPTAYPARVQGEDWRTPITLGWQSTTFPWWQQQTATTLSLTVAAEEAIGTLLLPGNAHARLEATLLPQGSTNPSRVRLLVGGQSLTLQGLPWQTGQVLRLTYTESGVLQLLLGEQSVLSCRTGDSVDELTAPCGQPVAVTVMSDAPVQCLLSGRGCWL